MGRASISTAPPQTPAPQISGPEPPDRRDVVALELVEEAAKGQRIVEMRDLFASDTVEAGEASYRWFEARFTMAKIAAIVTVLLRVGGVALLVVKKIKKRW